ncbi:MAG: hypothetical protein WB822_01500 [Rhodoplanes sp.]
MEVIKLPDVRRPERMPSLPAWVTSRVASLKTENQPDAASGKWRPISTLPQSLILSQTERDELVRHIRELDALCEQTPANDPSAEEATLVAVTKMMLALPSPQQNEASAEARGEAFMAALDDVASWAVSAAIRRWYRGNAGKNDRGEPYDCHWCPAPADLRSVAMIEQWRVKSRATKLRELVSAEPLIEFSEEHCQTMRKRLSKLMHDTFNIPLVGADGSGGTASTTS